MPPCPSNISSSPTPSNATSPNAPPSFLLPSYKVSPCRQSPESEVLKELLKLDPKKHQGQMV